MLIAGGRIVDPSQDLDAFLDVRIIGDRIAELGEHLSAAAGEDVLDVSGAFVAPGFIDMHVHLREPGQSQKETIATGTAAAARGGFTAVACMPNTQPAIDSVETVRWLRERSAANAFVRVHPIATITHGREGRRCVEFEELRAAGAVAFSDDGATIEDPAVERAAAQQVHKSGALVITHCEPEETIVERDLAIAEATGARWHVAHVSTVTALEEIRRAKHAGVVVTCEATPHHLTFTHDEASRLESGSAVNPPLRSASDVRELRQAVRDGTVDVLATDHAPHTPLDKRGVFAPAAPGFSGLEIAIGAYAHALPDLSVTRFVELLSTKPAAILSLSAGTLAVGSIADITVFGDREWLVDPATFASKGRCTPFAGMKLPRRAIVTIVGGRVVMRDGALQP